MKSKRERFVIIAVARTNRIIDDFRLLGNCSNKNNYEYNEEDIRKIIGTLEGEFKKLKVKFENLDEEKKFSL